MSRITIIATKEVTFEGDSLDTASAQDILSWFGMSGEMVLSLKNDGTEVAVGQDFGGMEVVAVVNGGSMHTSGVRPSGRDWPL